MQLVFGNFWSIVSPIQEAYFFVIFSLGTQTIQVHMVGGRMRWSRFAHLVSLTWSLKVIAPENRGDHSRVKGPSIDRAPPVDLLCIYYSVI